MKEIIYLDHSATTYVDPVVKKEMSPFFSDFFGNPGSLHLYGHQAKCAVDNSRKKVADIINATSNEIIFTGSGTESVNLAIIGLADSYPKKKHIISTNIEHHAVLHTLDYLKLKGYDITLVPVKKNGIVDPKDIEKEIRDDTLLITVMYANNEIGTIQPIKEIGEIAKKHEIFFHSDACQAGLLDLDVKDLNVDLLTLNGSKIYGPKGIGMLYRKKGVNLMPIIFGGSQEQGLRAGTENTPGIIGFAKALDLVQKNKDKEYKRLLELREKLVNNIMELIPNTLLNGDREKRLPGNANFTFLNVEGESLLLHLNEQGLCVSSGSACTSRSLLPSHVITALGYPPEAVHGSIRITLGKRNNEEHIDKIIKVLPSIVENLRKISPLNLTMDDFEKLKNEVKND